MSAKIFDGKKIAGQEEELLKQELREINCEGVPKLASLLIGKNYGAEVYANVQRKTAKRIGVDYELVKLTKNVPEDDLIEKINVLNQEESVSGIFLHRPIEAEVNEVKIRNSIMPCKDVECEHPENLGKIFSYSENEDDILLPPTPAAVLYTINKIGLDLYGKEVVIIGHSNIVGKPLALLLLDKFATVTVTHIATSEAGKLGGHVGNADLIISAVGKPDLIKGDWIKDNASIIDVGITKTKEGIQGDVEYEAALEKADFITPVPGGVGPLTVVFLMKNLIKLFKNNS